MIDSDLAGMLLFDPVNIRYATGHRSSGVAGIRYFMGYAVVPAGGEPVVATLTTPDGSYALDKGTIWDFFPCGRNVEEAARLWGGRIKDLMSQMGIAGGRLGVDKLDFFSMESLRAQEIKIADARVPLERARAIKTRDEV